MVRIIVDSAADFEPRELEALNISCIPLTVMFGEEEYQENVNLSKDQFYEKLLGSGVYPHTSRPSPYELERLFQEIRESGDEAVVLILSSKISGTYQDVCMAAKNSGCGEKCIVVDSKNGTGGIRMQAEYACRLRDEGCNAREIVDGIKSIRGRISLYACLDTLEYLRKGGRISAAVAAMGTLARVKPIIQVSETGTIEVPAKALGMARGQMYIMDRFAENAPDPDHPIYVMYTHVRENALRLVERLAKIGVHIPEERIINVGAAIGSHVGPNAVGMVYVKKH